MGTGTEEYYDRRADEYERVYDKPERQEDIPVLRGWIDELLTGRHVLELAAGTGFWTRSYADRAAAVVATDINASTLDVARAAREWPTTVQFELADAFDLGAVRGSFDAVFAGFLWSHVPLGRLDDLVAGIAARVGRGSVVVFADNNHVAGSNHDIVRTDPAGNTYQRRTLDDGSEWDVLKNFPTAAEIRTTLAAFGAVDVRSLDYFWVATLRT